ncbi:APG6-domain-containing protein [Westerdykella ornata]|uniref:APG6-domain-containing protein n=1 Tax=Westerdykella ornata TaxID=318751 RepID=A0A6A6JPP9_WESOR|nr:APG6-domain-containing protein [Westerdykella ornata]KAF2278113.1 APG6-domain-containing protein [Westerdykella ornata]
MATSARSTKDTTSAGLYCQKCRTPIEVDASIDQLNPAAFKLLTDSTVSPDQQTTKKTLSRQGRPPYPSSRNQTYETATQSARNPTFKRTVPHARYAQRGGQNPAMSFVSVHMSESMLDPALSPEVKQKTSDGSQPTGAEVTRRASATGKWGSVGGGKIADGMETTNRLFEILSARSDIDHPVCTECTELLVEGLQKRMTVATRERDAYVDYLRRANSDVPNAEEIKAAEAELEAARKSEAAALAHLERLEKEKAELDSQLLALQAESRALDKTENDFWAHRNAFSTALTSFQEERDALTTKYNHDLQLLTQLQRRSVYNDIFFITHDDHYATINGLRLGRLSTPYVDWPEINAAWGQTCLLLATLADRLGYKFQGYELYPMGSTSSILKLDTKPATGSSTAAAGTTGRPTVTKQRLELYSSGELPFNLGFMHRKFDTAMVAFLECLRQLGEFAEKSSQQSAGGGIGTHADGTLSPANPGSLNYKMPYEIRKDKIHDTSIKLSLSKEENWTKACKYVLTCCKFLLAHANGLDGGSGVGRRGR